MNERLAKAEALFHQALELPPEQREAFLQHSCGEDAELRREVAALLRASGIADQWLRDDCARVDPSPGSLPGSISEGPGTIVGRYKLLEQIGEGGFGVVYMAEQTEPVRRKIAVKIIKLGMDTRSVIARFEAERQALAMMDHANIAKVFDAGATDTGRPYFVMELVRGVPITKFCEENCLTTTERLDLFIRVCGAIQHAHQKGIIHRDIKPTNVLVTLNDGVPHPMVIDFGVAKAINQRLTEKTLFTNFAQMIGTPAYMSPEQAEMSKLDVDTRSDVYSLGVLLYELLTGTTPFPEELLRSAGYAEMQRIIAEEEPERPSTRLTKISGLKSRRSSLATSHSSLPTDLDWIAMKCLEKDRTRRYDTANGLVADLKRHLANEPVEARPPSAAYRLQKAWRRNKLAFATVVMVAAALVAGLGVSAWQATVANRAREAGQRLLYAANMNLAQQAWEQNNVGRVRQLLEETAAYPERGFEWYYWQRQTHLEIRTLHGHSDGVWAVAYSPDGQRIITGSSDHTAKIWETATGRELRTLEGHSDWVSSVVFSRDGRQVVTGSADQTAKVWDPASGKELRTLVGHKHWITSVAFSQDGLRLITGSHDNTAKVWDATSGENLMTLRGHGGGWGPGVSSAAFSPDGQRIVTGGHDKTAKIWDAASGKELLTFKGHTNEVWSVAFSPNGQSLVTGGGDQRAKVWDVTRRTELFTLPAPGEVGISSVAFSPDGQRIVTGNWFEAAKVWEAATGKELFTLKGHNDGVSSVAFSPDAQRILTGSRGHTAKIWDAAGAGEMITLKAMTLGSPVWRFPRTASGWSPPAMTKLRKCGTRSVANN